PTSVVLPAPKPPAMTIFADVTRPTDGGRGILLEPSKSTQHPLKQFRAHRFVTLVVQRSGLIHRDETFRGHVGDQDPRDPQWQPHPRRDLSERLELAVT